MLASVSVYVRWGVTLCALYLAGGGGVCVGGGRTEVRGAGENSGAPFCLLPPPSFLLPLRGGMNEVSIWFPQSPGLAHTQVCYGIHSPPQG